MELLIRAPRAIVDGVEQAVEIGVAAGVVVSIRPLADARALLDQRHEASRWSSSERSERIETQPEALRWSSSERSERIETLSDDEVLIPGLVDTHVHVNEPGRTEWEGFASATRAAAAGAVTTILDMPLNSVPATTTVAALTLKQQAAEGQVFVDVGFWGGAVPGNGAELAALHEAGVFGFKCFLLDSGVPDFPPLSAVELERAMAQTARLDALMIVHAELADLLDESLAGGPSYSRFVDSRPPAAEERAIDLVLATARRTGSRAHIVHLSAAAAIPALRAARRDGVDVSVETCPHYLCFEAASVPDGATQFKCCPPIRDADNREALWRGLGEGDVDFVVSDHSPCTPDLKRLDTGDFAAAWGGIASLQVGLAAVWTAARDRGHDLADVVRWMATGPADRVGLTDRGRIAVGARADLAVVAPEEVLEVDPARLRHRNPVTPYAGLRLTGTVRRTYLAGEPVDLDGPPRGRLIRRAP